jgi:biopolymer transport protein ExbD
MTVAAALLLAAGCTTSNPVKGAEKRPKAPQVAQEAGDAADEAEGSDLVLYSSSMEEADLQPGADEDSDDADEKAQPDEPPEVPEQVEIGVSADSTYTLGDQTFTEVPKLLEALEKLRAEEPTGTIAIRAAADAPQEPIVDLITAARRAGFTNMEIRVQGDAPQGTGSPGDETPGDKTPADETPTDETPGDQ